jgi:hypothetical protein
MYVTYFDEVKANPANGQNGYFFGGLSAQMSEIPAIEAEMNKLAETVFGSKDLTTSTEFHATDIWHRKGPFKNMDAKQRLDILEALMTILVSHQESLKRVYSEIFTDRLKTDKKPGEIAFSFFCERVQYLMNSLKSTTILIGDQDDENFRKMISDFATYRAKGTFWSYGVEITSVVDTVHFARSHHSRMIQLADYYVFHVSFWTSGKRGWMADEYKKRCAGRLFPLANRYKPWPGQFS